MSLMNPIIIHILSWIVDTAKIMALPFTNELEFTFKLAYTVSTFVLKPSVYIYQHGNNLNMRSLIRRPTYFDPGRQQFTNNPKIKLFLQVQSWLFHKSKGPSFFLISIQWFVEETISRLAGQSRKDRQASLEVCHDLPVL